jgi:hypothetical protein
MYSTGSNIKEWTRTLAFSQNVLEVKDKILAEPTVATKTVAAMEAAEAIFQLSTQFQPKWEGGKIRSGNMLISILAPANPDVKFIDWSMIKDSAGKGYSKGWRIDIRGGVTEYHVRLETFPLDSIPDVPPVEPPIPDPDPIPDIEPPTPPTGAMATYDAPWIDVANRDDVAAGKILEGRSWHYQGAHQWIRTEYLLPTDLIASAPTSAGGDRIWIRATNMHPNLFAHCCDIQPGNLTSRDGCLAKNTKYMPAIPPTNPEEDPEMIKELQEQIAALNTSLQESQLVINTLSADRLSLVTQIMEIEATNSDLSETIGVKNEIIAEQLKIIDEQRPLINEFDTLKAALSISNKYRD